MATIFATATPGRNTTHAIDWGRFALVGLGTIAAAVLANVLVFYVGGAVIFTVVPAIGAVLLYAALLRFARRPTFIFAIVAAVTFVATLIPDFTYAPTFPGATGGQIAVLVAMHVVAAVVLVGSPTRFSGGRER